MLRTRFIALILLPILLLQGCATAVVTGAAAGAAVAYDRRTTGSVIDDQGIEFKAMAAIRKNKEIYDQSHINVTSYNGRSLVHVKPAIGQFSDLVGDFFQKIPIVSDQ